MMSATSGSPPLKERVCTPLAFLASHWLNTDVMERAQALRRKIEDLGPEMEASC